ncbi:glycosyltransferase [Pseudohongiella sp. O18]|uniref:glycosyltransferase n=1 Tax=Pseudohongiella sp. O18 TaxID=2904248 RepID=UPI001F464342|nr:glycosyltransferase [Pseudohongiella sp. O18]
MTDTNAKARPPLVSILCRTVGRSSLAEALESVNRQSWQALELVLIDASGHGLACPVPLKDHVTLKLVNLGKPLDRPEAANVGLDHATGDYLLFLDDDDWIADSHIEKLLTAAAKHPECQVVYSATRKASADGQLSDDVIAVGFDRTVLRRDNFIPIHAALFNRRLLEHGVYFDTSLAVYEDWDFWLQCAEHTDFCLTEHVGAFYREGGDSQTMLEQHNARYQAGHPMADARAQVLDKWRLRWSGAEINAVMGLLDQSVTVQQLHTELKAAHNIQSVHERQIDSLQSKTHALSEELAETEARLQQTQTRLNDTEQQYAMLQSAHIELNLAHEQLDQGVREILNSFSWRVTGPYRYMRNRLNRVIGPFVNRLNSQLKPATRNGSTSVALSSDSPSHLQQTGEREQTVYQGPIEAGILQPTLERRVFSSDLTLQAWAWAPDGLQSVEVLVDWQHAESPAIRQHGTAEDAQRTGFATLVPIANLSPGPHELIVSIVDKAGNTRQLQQQFVVQNPQHLYMRWLQAHSANASDQQSEADHPDRGLPGTTCFVMLASEIDNRPSSESLATLLSLKQQSDAGWHLHIVGEPTSVDILANIAEKNTETHPTLLAALESCPTMVVLLKPGTLLNQDYVARISTRALPDTRLLYTDHDELAGDYRQNPWFTWSWAPDLLRSQDYIGATYAIDSRLAQQALSTKAVEDLNAADWRHQLLLEVAPELTLTNTVRVAEVLWSEPAKETLPAVDSAQTYAPLPVNFPRVSIIIPTTGKLTYLRPCLETLASTDYQDFEIIILDNGRGEHREGIQFAHDQGARVIECNEPFNWSRLNNIGVANSSGEILLFLNDDIEVMHPQWLTQLVRHAIRSDVGTVGARLLYPNGTLQHAGVFLVDHGGGARHLFHKQLPGRGIYQHLDQCVREVSANTGACLMIRRELFMSLGQFDENLAIVGNDIDLCLRCLEAGKRNVWTPHSELIHHESVSRKTNPIGQDERTMWERWGHRFKGGDPYYNPALSLTREDCTLSSLTEHQSSLLIRQSSTRSEPDFGVNLIAYIRASMGVGEASRGNASALHASGIPFGIINYERGNPSRMDNLRWQKLEIERSRFAINLWHINADHLPTVMGDLKSTSSAGRYNIGFWAWEMPEFPDRWLPSFEIVDEVWVPSSYVNQAVAVKSPVPVVTIPHVIDVDMTGACQYQREWFGIKEDAFVFISMFDTHSIAKRKNPFGSIRAFQQAFAADDMAVQLVIKINNADAASIKVLKECIADYQNIILIDSHLDRAQIDSLINCSDCYVSLHHAEGFGLGPAEAMFMGKVALLTGWSGNTEYMRNDNCVAIRYELKTLGKDYGPYEAHQHWAEPDISHAADEMRDLAQNPARVAALGARARQTIISEFSAIAIGKRMQQRLQNIERRLQGHSQTR